MTNSPAMAQTPATQTDGNRLMTRIVECSTIVSSDQRLECYDRQVSGLAKAWQSRSVVVLSRSDIADKKRELFGLQQPVIAALDRNDNTETVIDELDSTVRRVAQLGRDRLAVHLADGSLWHTLERTRIRPSVGDSIHIRRAALGSFIGSYRGSSIRMKRLR